MQGLRNALYFAITEIKSLKKENKALKEQIGPLENRQVEVMQLHEELKQKDDLLKRANKKRRARTGAHVENLGLLAQTEKQMKRSDEQWRGMSHTLMARLVSKANQLQIRCLTSSFHDNDVLTAFCVTLVQNHLLHCKIKRNKLFFSTINSKEVVQLVTKAKNEQQEKKMRVAEEKRRREEKQMQKERQEKIRDEQKKE